MAYYRDSLGNLLYQSGNGYFVDQSGRVYDRSEVGKIKPAEDFSVIKTPKCGVAYVASNNRVVFCTKGTNRDIIDAFDGESCEYVELYFPYKVPYEKGYYVRKGSTIYYYDGGLVVLSVIGTRLNTKVLDLCSPATDLVTRPHKYGKTYFGMDGNKHLFTEQGYYEIISGAKNSSFCPEW